jgi:hypothetical protein
MRAFAEEGWVMNGIKSPVKSEINFNLEIFPN